MITPSSQTSIDQLISSVSQSNKFKSITDSFYMKNMKSIYGVETEFNKDLRSIVVLSLYEKVTSGDFLLPNDLLSGDYLDSSSEAFNKVLKWLVNAYRYECIQRIRSRLPKYKGRGGDKMIFGSSFKESDFAGGIDQESHSFNFDNLADDNVLDSETTYFFQKLKDELKAQLGEEKQDILNDFFDGYSYTDLARKYGNTDKCYSQMIKRALEKLYS